MPSIKLATSIAATSTNENVLQGTDFEFLPYNAMVTISLAGSATGLVCDVKGDTEDLASGIIPNVASAAGRVVVPDDTVLSNEPLRGGVRLKLRAYNPTGGALTLNSLVEIEPIR